jgi:hypothetical protein
MKTNKPEKTFEEIIQGDYWQGRDTPETRKKAGAVLQRRKTEVRKRLEKKAPLFAPHVLNNELNELPTVDDLLARRRQVATAYEIEAPIRERELQQRIQRYKDFVAENMSLDYLQDCIAREESWRSSSENYWYARYHSAWLRREKPIGECEQKLLQYIVEWQAEDFSACEFFDCIYQVEGDGMFQGVNDVRDALNELALRAYIRLAGGRESKVINSLRVIAWQIDFLGDSL